MAHKCFECNEKLEKHDNCGDWFGYMMNHTGYVCPSCGTQYEKKTYNDKLKKRDKKDICLCGSKFLLMNYSHKWDVKVPKEVDDKYKFEGEIFTRTEKRNKKGHFKYELHHSPFEILLKLKEEEIEYIRKMIIRKAPHSFFSFEHRHSQIEYQHENIIDVVAENQVSVVELMELNHRYNYGHMPD